MLVVHLRYKYNTPYIPNDMLLVDVKGSSLIPNDLFGIVYPLLSLTRFWLFTI